MLYLTDSEVNFRAALGIYYLGEYANRLALKLQTGQECAITKRNLLLANQLLCIVMGYTPVDVSDPDDPIQLDCLTEQQIDDIYEVLAKIFGICWPAKGDTTDLNTYTALL